MTVLMLTAAPAEDCSRPLLISTDLRTGRVTVTGELERAGAHHLLDSFEALALGEQHTWVLDAAGITFCDVEGLRMLTRAHALAQSRGRGLVLAHARPFLLDLLTVVGMHRLAD